MMNITSKVRSVDHFLEAFAYFLWLKGIGHIGSIQGFSVDSFKIPGSSAPLETPAPI